MMHTYPPTSHTNRLTRQPRTRHSGLVVHTTRPQPVSSQPVALSVGVPKLPMPTKRSAPVPSLKV